MALSLLCLGLVTPWSPLHAQDKTKGSPKAKSPVQEQAPMQSQSIERYFSICDLDDSSWISFREASATMGITKAEFRDLDDDKDGRFSKVEFKNHSAQVSAWLGALPKARAEESASEALPQGEREPSAASADSSAGSELSKLLGAGVQAPTEGSGGLRQLLASTGATQLPAPSIPTLSITPSTERLPAAPYPSPKELLSLFDVDGSGGLSRGEVKQLIKRLKATLSADVIVDRTDRDKNGELGVKELGPLSFIASNRLPGGVFLGPEGPGSVELLGTSAAARKSNKKQPMNGLTGTEQFSHFARLDSDGNGRIDSADLRHKLTQSHSSVRASAVISALDADGDGGLDPEEFFVALRGKN